MTTEQKARAYDEALKVLHKYDGVHIMFTQDLKEEMFPELKESDDERIRKEITELIMQPTWKTEKEFHRRKELVAWLEKQGETSPILSNSLNIGKNEDKVEPKFKVGDWVMTAEDFIKDSAYGCSNELVGWSDGKEVVAYHEWLTPDQALRAVEIAREETMKKASDWLRSYFDFDEGNEGWVATISQKELDETFRKAMEE